MALVPSYNEKQLLTRIAQDDPAAFSAIFHYHFDEIYTAAFHLLKDRSSAEDICQQVFTALWEKRQNLDEIISLKNFLFIIARNLIMGQFRKEDTRAKYLRYAQHQGPGHPLDPEHILVGAQQTQLMERAIVNLPPKQQQAFRLSREQGLAHKDISRIMGITIPTVKEHISNSLAFIRKFLAHHTARMLPIALAWLLQ